MFIEEDEDVVVVVKGGGLYWDDDDLKQETGEDDPEPSLFVNVRNIVRVEQYIEHVDMYSSTIIPWWSDRYRVPFSCHSVSLVIDRQQPVRHDSLLRSRGSSWSHSEMRSHSTLVRRLASRHASQPLYKCIEPGSFVFPRRQLGRSRDVYLPPQPPALLEYRKAEEAPLPQAFRYDFGLVQNSTGIIKAPNHVRDTFGIDEVARMISWRKRSYNAELFQWAKKASSDILTTSTTSLWTSFCFLYETAKRLLRLDVLPISAKLGFHFRRFNISTFFWHAGRAIHKTKEEATGRTFFQLSFPRLTLQTIDSRLDVNIGSHVKLAEPPDGSVKQLCGSRKSQMTFENETKKVSKVLGHGLGTSGKRKTEAVNSHQSGDSIPLGFRQSALASVLDTSNSNITHEYFDMAITQDDRMNPSADGSLRTTALLSEETSSLNLQCEPNCQGQKVLDIANKVSISKMDKLKSSSSGQVESHSTLAGSESTVLPTALPKVPGDSSKYRTGGVYIAFGSNIGDRVEAIESACHMIDADQDMKLLKISPLYETEPMYVEDQAPFLNGVCEIETRLLPIELLNKLQAIEQNLGRVKMIDKGPRNIDLDILLYRDQVVQEERLTVPHALMLEREFVLRPLSHIFDRNAALVPTSEHRLVDFLERLDSQGMYTVTALSSEDLRPAKKTTPTLTMAIVNTTLDSFSDGGDNLPSEPDAIVANVAMQIAAGATIIDIGGQSSRPGAPDVSAEAEIARVVPAITAIKPLTDANNVLISVDTYRAAVAEAAVKAGANIVNDISAGALDPAMLATVARLGCSFVMMHMRGTPATMQSSENCSYPDGLLDTVRAELLTRVAAAESAGVFPWRIILDPGVGFSKTTAQNLELLTGLDTLRNNEATKSYAWLVGSSRKKFIGDITGMKVPKERVMGTSVTVTAAIMGGADIIRVHDVADMVQVAKMADAMYRNH
nr:folic acid synthesis protein fol1 [Quercus suber]